MCSCNCNRSCPNSNSNSNAINIFPDTTAGTLGMNCSPFPTNYLYGHAYTPTQIMTRTYSPAEGLRNGTIFPELVSPYYPGQSIDFINYLRNGGI